MVRRLKRRRFTQVMIYHDNGCVRWRNTSEAARQLRPTTAIPDSTSTKTPSDGSGTAVSTTESIYPEELVRYSINPMLAGCPVKLSGSGEWYGTPSTAKVQVCVAILMSTVMCCQSPRF
jgi:hypothetical protein